MGFLENLFRRQFRRDGAGYVFVRREHEVRFTADEVEAFVAEWRRLWLNPLLWGGWLLTGLGGPYWLARSNFAPGAWTLGLVAAGLVATVLLPSLLRPREVAEAQLPDEPASVGLEKPWMLLLMAALSGFLLVAALWRSIETGFGSSNPIIFALVWGIMFLTQLLRWRRSVKSADSTV